MFGCFVSGIVLCVGGHSHSKMVSYSGCKCVSFICVHRNVNLRMCFGVVFFFGGRGHRKSFSYCGSECVSFRCSHR